MEKPELLSQDAGQSAAQLIDEMSRLYYLARALHVAAELGVADRLGDDAPALAELAAKTGANAAALARLLRFLSAYRVFEERSPGRFCNTALSSALREDHPQSMRANLRRIGGFWWSAVGALEHAVRTGESGFAHVHGLAFFEYLGANPEAQRRFDEGMARISDLDDAAIAAAFDFGRFSRIVDVGGGHGGLLARILARAPDAAGVLFEQPQVVTQARRLQDAGLMARAELVAGDFFRAVPKGGDCYVIKGVLHDFDDEQCVTILKNCRRAMRRDGCVVIANRDPPSPTAGPHPNLTMDLQMMALFGGRERSGPEWAGLLRSAGLRPGATVRTEVGFTIVQGIPDCSSGSAIRSSEQVDHRTRHP
jgi:SAM-dependent methyltransferase